MFWGLSWKQIYIQEVRKATSWLGQHTALRAPWHCQLVAAAESVLVWVVVAPSPQALRCDRFDFVGAVCLGLTQWQSPFGRPALWRRRTCLCDRVLIVEAVCQGFERPVAELGATTVSLLLGRSVAASSLTL